MQKAKVNRDTLPTKTDLAEHKRMWQYKVDRQESRIPNLEERVDRLEQDRRSSVDLSGGCGSLSGYRSCSNALS